MRGNARPSCCSSGLPCHGRSPGSRSLGRRSCSPAIASRPRTSGASSGKRSGPTRASIFPSSKRLDVTLEPVPDPDSFAALLCDWCLEVQAGQQVLIGMTFEALPLVRALNRALLRRGAWPLLRPALFTADFYRPASAEQLDGFAPLGPTEPQDPDAPVRL